MTNKILFTSFQTWLPHHSFNSSDNLLAEIQKQNSSASSLTFLRRLPVDIPQASGLAIEHINRIRPDLIICCGMAESRQLLTIESNATSRNDRIQTSIDLDQLVTGLSFTRISHDAGKFVCEGLYYRVLEHLQKFQPQTQCIFLHVPVLTTGNSEKIVADIETIFTGLNLKNSKNSIIYPKRLSVDTELFSGS